MGQPEAAQPRPEASDAAAAEIARLRRENERLRRALERERASSAPNNNHLDQEEVGVSRSQPGGTSWLGCGLGTEEIERYARHLVLPSYGIEAHKRLRGSSVLVVGAGGLGSPAAIYLAASGVGRIGIVDQDSVELSNLHRQIAHGEDDVGVHKANSAAATMRRLNRQVVVEAIEGGVRADNALALVERFDAVVDCSDNPATRYCVSDACVVVGRPLISGAAVGTDGQLSVYSHGEDCPCYRCVWPEAPDPGNAQRWVRSLLRASATSIARPCAHPTPFPPEKKQWRTNEP